MLMFGIYALVALGIISAINIAGNLTGHRTIVVISKPLLVPCIIVFLISGGGASMLSLIFAIALVFGWGGDVALLWKKTSPKAVLLGLLSFMTGHVFYIITFGLAMGWFSSWQWWLAILAIPYVLYALEIYRLLRAGLEKMKIPAIVYLIVLLNMSFFALAMMVTLLHFTWLTFVGSLLFVISDSVLAVEQFKKHDEILHHSIVMVTYIAAQLLIVTGFVA